MSDEKSIKKKIGVVGIIKWFLIYITVVTLVWVATAFILDRNKSLYDNEINRLNEEKSKRYELIKELKKENSNQKTLIENLQKKLENLKTSDDLLQNDMTSYIKVHYRKVPNIVAKNIASNAIKFGKQYKISPILLMGIIQTESSFNPMVTGPNTKYGNARGLMQVMPEWVKKLGLTSVYDLYNIDLNIEAGCKVFNIHLKEGKGKISEGLYLYVNKDKKYVTDVFKAMGKFVAFRSTLGSGNEQAINDPVNGNGKKEKEKKNDTKTGKS